MDALAYDDEVKIPPPPPIDVREAPLAKRSPLGMPGLYPGRVVELSDHRSIAGNRVSQPIVRQMLERGMRELTGESSARAAWAKFVEPKDVVGIKINPSGAPASCSSPELVREIINAVQSAGVPARNIVVYDRFGYEMDMGGYQVLMPPGIRGLGVQDGRLDASGYDAEIYCQADFFGEWETRSYMASVVARQVDKIINVPTLKDHSASGVTGCLKNVGYGTFNNVARSHRAPFSFTNPLIGVMCSVEPLRSKTVLNIMDGTRMVWHGGPLTQNQSFIYQAGILLVGTEHRLSHHPRALAGKRASVVPFVPRPFCMAPLCMRLPCWESCMRSTWKQGGRNGISLPQNKFTPRLPASRKRCCSAATTGKCMPCIRIPERNSGKRAPEAKYGPRQWYAREPRTSEAPTDIFTPRTPGRESCAGSKRSAGAYIRPRMPPKRAFMSAAAMDTLTVSMRQPGRCSGAC